ncbi:hypothetical protein LXA43DRAFT_1097879 [Ganoderma leucocontextum]|nr:hypothetical protein LXA43DRAFT_1097879 [Ganoderma leucocontextum]
MKRCFQLPTANRGGNLVYFYFVPFSDESESIRGHHADYSSFARNRAELQRRIMQAHLASVAARSTDANNIPPVQDGDDPNGRESPLQGSDTGLSDRIIDHESAVSQEVDSDANNQYPHPGESHQMNPEAYQPSFPPQAPPSGAAYPNIFPQHSVTHEASSNLVFILEAHSAGRQSPAQNAMMETYQSGEGSTHRSMYQAPAAALVGSTQTAPSRRGPGSHS